MLKTILALPDGTEVSSGTGTINAIQSVTLTECVNDSEELTLGSACSNALEVTLFTPAGGLALDAGLEVTVHKECDGVRQQVGVFTLEKPTRPSANTMKVTGYDRVSKLDKDLTAWLSGLTEWPYPLTTFAGMVCNACGLTFKESEAPNGDFLVDQFTRSSVTGRQLMQWLGEVCCRFCRATPDGDIEFAWYTDSGKTITPSGDTYYLQNSLTYEDYTTAEIEAVQIRMADGENGVLWPETEEGVNSYIIAGNPILNLRITEDLVPVLANIKDALAGVRYTPCKVSIPARLDIRAGNTVAVTDKNGKTFTAYVMTKTQAGQKDTLECTGSHRRDSTTAANNKTSAQAAVDAQTQQDIFNKLTNNGTIQGIYAKDGKWYVNGELAQIVNLVATNIVTGILKSKDGETFYLDLDKGELKMRAAELSISGKTVQEIADESAEGKAKAAVDAQTQEEVFNKLTNNKKSDAIALINGQLYINASRINSGILSAGDASGETLYVNTETGEVRINAKSLSINGIGAASENYATTVAKGAVDAQTQRDIFNKLVGDNPAEQGVVLKDGKLYIDATYITVGELYGLLFKAGKIESLDGKIFIDLASGGNATFNSGISCNGLCVRADEIGANSALKVGTIDATDGSKLVSITGENEDKETFLVLQEATDPEGSKTGGYLGLFGANESVARMLSNTYGGSIYLGSKYGGNIRLETGSQNSFKSSISVDSIVPGEKADFSWQYISSIGKTVLVRG